MFYKVVLVMNNTEWIVEESEWEVIHINRQDKTCLIRKGKGQSYPCTLADWLVDGIMLRDYVDVKFNPVSREWIVTDYRINVEVYGAIHNSYQTTIDGLMLNEEGVPYE